MLSKSNKLLWFSAGGTSAIACKLAIKEYGKENCDIWYIGIKSAHKDNARFIDDCEKWYDCEINTITSKKYEDQFDVIRSRRFINGPVGALCTHELKKRVRLDLQKHYADTEQIFGFDFCLKEINRSIRFNEQYPEANAIFPLIANQVDKKNCLRLLQMNGIRLPKMYELGYSNNNCVGCVKGGKGYWNKIRIDFPDEFYEMAEAEIEVGRSCIKGTFLKDLKPGAGRMSKAIIPDCGDFCEIKFADIIDQRALDIFNNRDKTIKLIDILS